MPNSRMFMHVLSRLAKWLFIGIAFGFIIFYVSKNSDQIEEILNNTDKVWIIPLISSIFLASLIRAILWAYLIRSLGSAIRYFRLIGIWMYSLCGKYVPGSIWMAVGRAYSLQAEGVPIKTTSYSIVLEQLMTLAAGFIVVLITPEIIAALHIPPWLVLLILPLIAILLFPNLLGEIVRKAGIRKIDLCISPPPPLTVMIVYLVGTIITFIISGLGIILVIRVLNAPTHGLSLLNASGFNAAGFVAGYITFIAPSGIGVREGVLTLLLNRYISMPHAIIIAFSLRIWSLISDCIAILIGNIYINYFGKNQVLEKGAPLL